MSNKLRIEVLQQCSTDNPTENQDQIIRLLNQIVNPQEVDLICLPENSLFMKISSKSPKVSFGLNDEILKPLIDFAKANTCHILIGASPMDISTGVGNSTVWISPNGETSIPYSKIHLFDVDVDGEKPVRESDQFVAGSVPKVIDILGWRVGLSICYDLRFAELYSVYAREKVDLIVVPSAFLKPTGAAHWEVLQRARAIECQCYVVSAAQGGVHNGAEGASRESYGHSIAVDPWGRVIQQMADDVGSMSVTLSKENIHRVRGQIPMESHRKL